MTTDKQLNSDVKNDLKEYKKSHDSTSLNSALNEINQWQRQNGQNGAASKTELKQLNTILEKNGSLPGLKLTDASPQLGQVFAGLVGANDSDGATGAGSKAPPSIELQVQPGKAKQVAEEFANATLSQESGGTKPFLSLFEPGSNANPQTLAAALAESGDTTPAITQKINSLLKQDGSALEVSSTPFGLHTGVANQGLLEKEIESNFSQGINNETNSHHEQAYTELQSAQTDVQALESISNKQQRAAAVNAINQKLKGNSATDTTSINDQNGQLQINSASSAYEFGSENIEAQSNQYVAGKVDLYDGKRWQQSINPTGVNQGALGDCGSESMVASLAGSSQGQQQIHNMIKPNSDGSFTVTFPGNKNHPVNITASDLNQVNQGNNESTWARVLEAAYMKTVNHGDLSDAYVHSNVLKAPDGGDPNYYLLTGKVEKTDSLEGSSSPANLHTVANDLQNNFEHGNLSVAASTPNPEATSTSGVNNSQTLSETSDTHPIVPGHSYSVIAYENGMVTVRNPWGNNNGTIFGGANGTEQSGKTVDGITDLGNGELRMSLQEFTQNFSGVETSSK